MKYILKEKMNTSQKYYFTYGMNQVFKNTLSLKEHYLFNCVNSVEWIEPGGWNAGDIEFYMKLQLFIVNQNYGTGIFKKVKVWYD